VSYDLTCTQLEVISCGVPQGSILGPLLFLLYINDIHLSSKFFNFVLFADDTNIFFSGSNLKFVFSTVNTELTNLNDWFKANKLSVNIDKTKYILFIKPSKTDSIPLKLPDLFINNIKVKRVHSMKILSIIFDDHLNWKNHIQLVENNISKALGILYKTKHLLNRMSLKSLYFSFIHSHISYCNIAWASNYSSFLKKIYNKQKQASRIILNADRYACAEPLLTEINVLNIYKLNIYRSLIFMFKIHNNMLPAYFQPHFTLINHKYSTRHSIGNFLIPTTSLKKSDFSITCRGPRLWNSILNKDIKNITSIDLFKKTVKRYLLNLNNKKILLYFKKNNYILIC